MMVSVMKATALVVVDAYVGSVVGGTVVFVVKASIMTAVSVVMDRMAAGVDGFDL